MPKEGNFIRGNESLKKPNVVEYVTEEQQLEYINELKRCREDIVYFAERFFTIISPQLGKHKIKLYEKQKQLLRAMVDKTRVISCASRQVGKTTTYTIFALHQTIFYPEQKILIAANKKDTALEILSRIQLAYEHLPNWLKPGVVEYNKGNMKFSNLSAITGVATGSTSARGSSANILILDEFSFVPQNICKEFWNSVYPVISSSSKSKVIIVSTPNGVGNLYHTIWEKSQTGDIDDEGQGWYGVRIDWWDVPGRDKKWKKQQIDALGEADFEVEFGNSFISSTTPKLVNERLMQKFRQFLDKHEGFGKTIKLDMYEGKKFEIRIYHKFREDRSYLLSADVGEGVGKDYSVCYIWDVTDTSNITMCAKFSSNNTSTSEFAYVISRMYHFYGRPWMAIEANSIGRSVIDLLIQLYHCENHVIMNKGGAGIFSHAQSKSKACRFVRNFIDVPTVNINIYDKKLVDEMDYFIQKDTARHILFQASQGKHDDHMMAFIWALYVLSSDHISNYYNILRYTKTELGDVLPLHISSILNNNSMNLDTVSILDEEWNKQKEKIINNFQYMMDKNKPKRLDYFDSKPTMPGILGKMERMEKMEDCVFEGETFGFFGGLTEEW